MQRVLLRQDIEQLIWVLPFTDGPYIYSNLIIFLFNLQ